MRCAHLEDPLDEGSVCAPLSAQSETLGVLHLLQAAYSALYRAKAGGRDRVVVAMIEDRQEIGIAAS